MKKINAVIVDDEEHNIDLLARFLKKYCPMVSIIGWASTKEDAIQLINEEKPQLVFLDVVLDVGTGFDVLRESDHKNLKVIFATAFNEYAVKAFKVNAVDYLLKPIDIEELIISVTKAYGDIEKEEFTNQQQLKLLSETIFEDTNKFDFITIPSMEKIVFVKTNDIIYLESDGRYTHVHLEEKKKLMASKNLGEFEKNLARNFFRIHKLYIVNLDKVVSFNKAGGNYCELGNGKMLPVAKRRQTQLLYHLGLR